MAIRGNIDVIFRGNGTESTVMMCEMALDSKRMTSVAASILPRNSPCSIRFIFADAFRFEVAAADLVETTETSILSKKSLLLAFLRRS